jgi:hypothetical protein
LATLVSPISNFVFLNTYFFTLFVSIARQPVQAVVQSVVLSGTGRGLGVRATEAGRKAAVAAMESEVGVLVDQYPDLED